MKKFTYTITDPQGVSMPVRQDYWSKKPRNMPRP